MTDATGISVRIELAGALRAGGGWKTSGSELPIDGPTRTALTVMMVVEDEPPTGEIQLGTLRWRFANRVEMLQAIDVACEEAIRDR